MGLHAAYQSTPEWLETHICGVCVCVIALRVCCAVRVQARGWSKDKEADAAFPKHCMHASCV